MKKKLKYRTLILAYMNRSLEGLRNYQVSNGGRGPPFSGAVEGLYSVGIRLKQLLYSSCSEHAKHMHTSPNQAAPSEQLLEPAIRIII